MAIPTCGSIQILGRLVSEVHRQKKLEDKGDRVVLRTLSEGKIFKKEECKGGDTQANSTLRQAEPFDAIDGTKPLDLDNCLNGTTLLETFLTCAEPLGALINFLGILLTNLLWYLLLKDTSQKEKGEDHNHPPLETLKTPKTCLKLGKQRKVSKSRRYGAQEHHSTESRNLKLLVFLLIPLSRSGCGIAASVPSTQIPTVAKPSMTETLPPSLTGETWLDRKEVENLISKRSLIASFRGFTNISLDAFNGLTLDEIFLSGNYLTVLPDGLFQNVHGLQRVYLDHNLFTLLPVALNNCPDLLFFDISYNDIKEIPRHSISKATNLLSFDVSGNRNLGNYPDDAFFLQNLSIVYLRNTSIKSLPFPPPSSELNGTYSFRCDEYIVTLMRETGDTKFDLQNTGALSSKNLAVTFHQDPEQRLIPFNCIDRSFGPVGTVENRPVLSTVASIPDTNVNVSLNSNETDSSSPRTTQNKSSAGVPLWILGVIFGICICTLHLKIKEDGKNGLTHWGIGALFAVAVVVAMGTLYVAWFWFITWEALCLLGGAVAVLAVESFYLFKIKRNKEKKKQMKYKCTSRDDCDCS